MRIPTPEAWNAQSRAETNASLAMPANQQQGLASESRAGHTEGPPGVKGLQQYLPLEHLLLVLVKGEGQAKGRPPVPLEGG